MRNKEEETENLNVFISPFSKDLKCSGEELESFREMLSDLRVEEPLADTVFKKLVEDNEWFITIVELILGRKLEGDQILSIQGEMLAKIGGKTVRTDVLKVVGVEKINLEAQIDAANFIYKRHLAYASMTYLYGLTKGKSGEGNYKSLLPITSIVIYKDKGESAAITDAKLSGTLVDDNEGNLFNLVAVNARKWRDIENPKLRALLCILYNGTYTFENEDLFKGVDKSISMFWSLNRTLYDIANPDKVSEILRGGRNNMGYKFQFLSEEERIKAEESGIKRGIEQGMEKTKREIVFEMLANNVSDEVIIKCVKLSPEELEQFKSSFRNK